MGKLSKLKRAIKVLNDSGEFNADIIKMLNERNENWIIVD